MTTVVTVLAAEAVAALAVSGSLAVWAQRKLRLASIDEAGTVNTAK